MQEIPIPAGGLLSVEAQSALQREPACGYHEILTTRGSPATENCDVRGNLAFPEGVAVIAAKRKIKAKPLVRDLRNGMGDEELMEKYALSPLQFHKVLGKLVNAGVLDEMELFMRTSLSDSCISKAFVETDLAGRDFANRVHTGAPPDVDSKVEVDITEQVANSIDTLGRKLSKLTGWRP